MANRTESARIELDRIDGPSLSKALDAAGLPFWEFCSLFDLNFDTSKRWFLPEDHKRALEPPYWVTPVALALADPDLREGFLSVARMARAQAGAPVPA